MQKPKNAADGGVRACNGYYCFCQDAVMECEKRLPMRSAAEGEWGMQGGEREGAQQKPSLPLARLPQEDRL